MFKTILVPLDGSEFAERALPFALDIAQAHKSDVILLRAMVMVPRTVPQRAYVYDFQWPDISYESARLAVDDYLNAMQERWQRPGVAVMTQIPEGDEASAILEAARANRTDLIVMTSHGRSGIERWLMGSVTEHVLDDACCPVLVVRERAPIRRVLIPLDGSNLSERALVPGMDLAHCLNASVTLLRVIPSHPVSRSDALELEWLERETGEYVEQTLEEFATNYLEAEARPFRHAGLEVETAVRMGPVADTILDFVTQANIDLIAMTTHGRSGLRRWLYGSVSLKLLRSVERAMLIVRPPAQELN